MSGYGGCDDEAAHALILADNEIDRVRAVLAKQATRPSACQCADCDADIPLARQQLVPGTQYCVDCAPNHESVVRVRMLDKIL